MASGVAPSLSVAGSTARRLLARRMLLALLLINLFVLGLIGHSLYLSQRQYHQEAAINAGNLAQVLAGKLEAEIGKIDLALLAVAHEHRQQRDQGRVDGAELDTYIRKLVDELPFIDSIRLTDADGILRYGPDVTPDSRVDLSDRAHFAALRDDPGKQLVFSRPQVSRVNHRKVIVLARHLSRPDGGFDGMVFAPMPMQHLTEVFDDIDIDRHGSLALLDEDTQPIEHHPGVPVARAREALLCGAGILARRRQAGEDAGVFTTRPDQDNCAQSIAFQRVGEYPLYIKVGLSSVDYLARWRQAATRAALVAALFLALSLVAAARLQRDWRRSQELHDRLAEQEARFRTLADHSRDWVYWQRPDRGFVYMTPSCEAITGYPAQAFMQDPALLERIVHPDDRNGFNCHLDHDGDKREVVTDFRILRPDGEVRWLSHTCVPIHDETGRDLGRHVSNRDITQRKQDEIRLRQMSEAMAQSQQAMALTDPEQRFTYVNPAFSHLFGYLPEEVLGESKKLLQPRDLNTNISTDETTRQAERTGSFHGRVLRRGKDGSEIPIMLNVTPVHDAAGKLSGYVCMMADLTELEQRQAELEYTAQHDALTGLPNRLLLRDRLQQALALAARQEKLLAVCYLDLDGFKPVNDRYGHKTGDHVLIEVSHRLQRVLRSSDTVARLGGDEFVLLLVDLTSTTELEHILNRLLHDLSVSYSSIVEGIELTASLGVALYPLNEGDPDMLLRNADKAMYMAKQSGKNRYSFFDPSEELRTRTEHEIRQRIQAGLRAGEFTLHYQPKVDMRAGTVIGAEALLRWQHPDYGLRMPGSFLPFVESHDLIIEIGDWVLRQALDQIRAWRAEGIELQVSVNIAARQLQHPDFIQNLTHLLASYPDIPSHRLELEILESTALDDIERVHRLIGECERLGVRFALDDFGTGYSSLTYLKRLPAHTLKIDQSFVRDILEDPEDLAITEGVLGLARAFQRLTIAEGVETVRHGSMLLHLGCDHAQGYGIARPMPAESLGAWLKTFRPAEEWLRAAELRLDREDFPLLAMEVEHRRWVGQLVTAVERREPGLLPAHVPNHRVCNFGRWLLGEGHSQYHALPEFKRLIQPHREVHRIGQRIATLLVAGEHAAAEAAAAEIIAQRDKVLEALDDLQRAAVAARHTT